METDSVFIQMLKGGIPATIAAQDADHAAILEPCPVAPGHIVVFPKKITDALFDLSPQELANLMHFAQKAAQALKLAVPCDKIAVVVYGIKVRHVHLHLIPAQGIPGEIALDKPRLPADPAALSKLAQEIAAHL